MINDIVAVENGKDLRIEQNEAPRAGNVLSTQLGSLEYAPNFGVDLKYFLTSEFKIQNSSFKAYCVQRLLEHGVNVVNVLETIATFHEKYTFEIGSSENSGGLIA